MRRTTFVLCLGFSILFSPLVGRAVDDGGLTDLFLTPEMAQTSWPTLHRDLKNSDAVPWISAREVEQRWHSVKREGMIPGTANFDHGSEGCDGSLYFSDMRGPGFPGLHFLDPKTGATRFATAPWQPGAGLVIGGKPNVGFSTNQPLVDADCNLYHSAALGMWSLDPDGNFRWFRAWAEFATQGGANPILSQGFVGIITGQGVVIMLDRATGATAMPTLQLPGVVPSCPPELAELGLFFWNGGEVWSALLEGVFCGAQGFDILVTNTSTVHPITQRIFNWGGGPDFTTGFFHGIDVVDDGGGNFHLELAFSTVTGAASGTSPAMSPDNEKVWLVTVGDILRAFDTTTGAEVLTVPDGGDSTTSPTVGLDNNLYNGNEGALVSVDGDTGAFRWEQDFASLTSLVPDLPPIPMFSDGKPEASVIAIPEVAEDRVWTGLNLVYNVTLEPGGDPLPLSHLELMASVDVDTGEILESSITEMPGIGSGFQSPLRNGFVYVSQLDDLSSLAFYVLNPILPPPYRVSGPILAGVLGYEPTSFLEMSQDGLAHAQGLDAASLAELPGGDLQLAFDNSRKGRIQLQNVADYIDEAVSKGEVSAADGEKARKATLKAEGKLTQARNFLDSPNPTPEDQAEAAGVIESAQDKIQQALGRLM